MLYPLSYEGGKAGDTTKLAARGCERRWSAEPIRPVRSG